MHEGLEEFCKSRNLFEYLKLLVQLRIQHLQRAMFVSDLHAVFPNNPKHLLLQPAVSRNNFNTISMVSLERKACITV